MKKLTASLLFASAITHPATGQEERERIAPDTVYEITPALGEYTDNVLFGDNWQREILSARDRSLITISTLIATGKTPQLQSHFRLALENGVTPDEISEVITHLAFYSGWPNAISSVYVAKEVFDAQGVAISNADFSLLQLNADEEAARRANVDTNVRLTAPELADKTDKVLFDRLWRRPQLAPRDRSLVTLSALVAAGQAEQLTFHANRAMNAGMTKDQMGEVLSHIAYYAGWPRAMSAVGVLKAVFENQADISSQKPLGIVRRRDAETRSGPAENFTGKVTVGPFFTAPEPAKLRGALVRFEAGARTAWHSHPLGQTLYITDGCGWMQSEGYDVIEVSLGDIVQIPPNTRHWHGACNDEAMAHVAMLESKNGKSTEWMEKVSNAEYKKGNHASAK